MIKSLALRFFFSFLFVSAIGLNGMAQSDSLKSPQKKDYQIYLKQPAKEIKLLMYEKSFTPIQGKLSEDKKSIIMKDYERGNKVHVKVIYEDGTVEDFTKSPCFIDPVVT
jgi:hypothetical protein